MAEMKAALLAAALFIAPAAAQERPATMPTRDVDVIYRMGGGLEQRMRWGVTLGKLRVDPPSPGLWVVLDTRTRVMETVREGERSVLRIDAGAATVPGMAGGAKFVRHGTAQVAGLDCTLWDTTDSAGRPTTACLTADGVLLRAEGGGTVLVEATRVVFAPLPASVFDVPADYKRIIAPSTSHSGG